jgi:hypothetical protein
MLVAILLILIIACSVYSAVAVWRAFDFTSGSSVADLPIQVRAYYFATVAGFLGSLSGLVLVVVTWGSDWYWFAFIPVFITGVSAFLLWHVHDVPKFGIYQSERIRAGLPRRRWWQWPDE